MLLVIVGSFLLGTLIGVGALMLNQGSSNKNRVITSGQALIGGPFELVGKDGKTVTDKDFRGRYMLVFFGFTHCPDICPAELQVMSAALDELGDKADKVVPIFITVDPERDTPELVTAYVENFGPNFVGLTGSPEAIANAAKAYRVTYQKFQEEGAGDNYSVDHSALLYLMGPDGTFVTHFPYGTSPEKMAETLRRYL
ncbi:cytochrome oxidase biogenesis protein Sco1/SenC/PrrC, putative copper metallochaperone [Methyloceanibacter caenitepidi]|uniref:Cytochrome oxidase biogenesis protein Sco1/SenC/PrrC, putative copper metallochaperone n=1 Tax=Methyloceanibacter caenitepidi TaxID=1384459 RepID=A0A0A8K034_9HYPH|nr:cytochrome oxidase biogenesis protein Sco1/SenC/PrrC, putative copper metallochaperone [Methyloceanibacter caenitepidi]